MESTNPRIRLIYRVIKAYHSVREELICPEWAIYEPSEIRELKSQKQSTEKNSKMQIEIAYSTCHKRALVQFRRRSRKKISKNKKKISIFEGMNQEKLGKAKGRENLIECRIWDICEFSRTPSLRKSEKWHGPSLLKHSISTAGSLSDLDQVHSLLPFTFSLFTLKPIDR